MAAATQGRVPPGNWLPLEFTTTHDTDGLSGWGALDWFRQAGTIVGAPMGGTVERVSGGAGSRGEGIYGRSVYIRWDSGQRSFLTHFGDVFVRPAQRVEQGEPLGRVADYGSADHIHYAVQGAPSRGTVKLGEPAATGSGGSWRSKPDSGNEAKPGGGGGLVPDILPDLNPFDDVGEWLATMGIRTLQVVGGFVLLLVGLALLGRRLGVAGAERMLPVGGGLVR